MARLRCVCHDTVTALPWSLYLCYNALRRREIYRELRQPGLMVQRKESQFRNFIEPGGRFPPEGTAKKCLLSCTASPASAQAGLFSWPSCVCNYVSAGIRRVAQLVTWLAVAAGRYHLYISLACPWANRCLAVRNLKVRLSSPV